MMGGGGLERFHCTYVFLVHKYVLHTRVRTYVRISM